MVLKNRGIQPIFGREKGDLFVTFTVQVPRQVFVRKRPRCCPHYVDSSVRSLTDRQREILQAYADDVEGRSTKKPRDDGAEAADSASLTGSNSNAQLNHDNGTTHFSSSASHQPGDSWLSRMRRKIRELTRT
jgi:molecular chaperone DnaJ